MAQYWKSNPAIRSHWLKGALVPLKVFVDWWCVCFWHDSSFKYSQIIAAWDTPSVWTDWAIFKFLGNTFHANAAQNIAWRFWAILKSSFWVKKLCLLLGIFTKNLSFYSNIWSHCGPPSKGSLCTVYSVTTWIFNFTNIWPFTTMDICPIA